MASSQAFVIVGASLAGAKAAETLREEGFEGRILLFGDEAVRPYERPPLSKDYLRGESDFDAAAVHEEGFYDKHGIELRTSTPVARVDPRAADIELGTGERVPYDRLLLATGAYPRRLTIPGADLPGVRYLRSVADSDALREAIVNAANSSSPVVVLGAGWIGAEVAASSRQLGADVSMIDLASLPLERVLGAEVGAFYRDLHIEHGVKMHLGAGIEALHGANAVEEVRLANGKTLPAGLVVVGVGVLPRTELAESAGLDLDNGVLTDEHFLTSTPNIYAAGDVANVFYPMYGTHIRLEHWSAALNQGPAAAKNMVGHPTAYDKVPYFYSDQYDFDMEYRGWSKSYDQVVFRGDVSRREFISFWLEDSTVVAAMNGNIWDQGEPIEALLRARRPVEPEQLADPKVELNDLIA